MSIDKTQNIDSVKNDNITDKKLLKSSSIENEAFKDLLKNYINKTSSINRNNNAGAKLTSNIKEPTLEKKLQSDNEAYNSFNDLKVNNVNDTDLNSTLITEILKKENSVSEIEHSRKLKLEEIKNKVNSGFYQTDDIIKQTAGKIIDSTVT